MGEVTGTPACLSTLHKLTPMHTCAGQTGLQDLTPSVSYSNYELSFVRPAVDSFLPLQQMTGSLIKGHVQWARDDLIVLGR